MAGYPLKIPGYRDFLSVPFLPVSGHRFPVSRQLCELCASVATPCRSPPAAKVLPVYPTRFLFEILILAFWLWNRRKGFKLLRRRRRKRRRLNRRQRRMLLKASAAAILIVFLVIPQGLGLLFPQLRHFPTFLEGHKLLFTYGLLDWAWVQVSGEPDLHSIVRRESSRRGVDPALAWAILQAESGGRRQVVSRAGAMGLMQLMPTTYFSMRWDNPFDAENNIAAGVEYLAQLQKRFAGNTRLMIAAYHAGPSLVARCRCVPSNGETPRYVSKVMRLRADRKASR